MKKPATDHTRGRSIMRLLAQRGHVRLIEWDVSIHLIVSSLPHTALERTRSFLALAVTDNWLLSDDDEEACVEPRRTPPQEDLRQVINDPPRGSGSIRDSSSVLLDTALASL